MIGHAVGGITIARHPSCRCRADHVATITGEKSGSTVSAEKHWQLVIYWDFRECWVLTGCFGRKEIIVQNI